MVRTGKVSEPGWARADKRYGSTAPHLAPELGDPPHQPPNTCGVPGDLCPVPITVEEPRELLVVGTPMNSDGVEN